MSDSAAPLEPADRPAGHHPHNGLTKLAVGAIGVVYGDIGTSPIYAFRETFAGHHPLPAGPTEIITPGVDGLLTPYGDADRLAGAILRYLDDPAFAARSGEAARRRAPDFSVTRYAGEIVRYCREFVV